MLCGNFILPEPASYVSFYAVFNLRNLLYFINMDGASFAMAAMILGFVTNILQGYTLVWVVNWGMAGAALATIIGQAVTMVASILFFLVKNAVFPCRAGKTCGHSGKMF